VSNPRRANGHRRDQLRRRVLAEEDDCWLCGLPVDKALPPYLSGSPEVDEVIPVSLGGSPFDRSNCRLSHRLCNIRRGNGTKTARRRPEPLTTTRRWS
jgi:5-methylcytosine-specific restriction endonuclease McrA